MSSSPQTKRSSWLNELLNEQALAVEFLVDRLKQTGGAALFAEQGTGKTVISLSIFELLNLQEALIVAPLTALDLTWGQRLKAMGYDVYHSFDLFKQASGKKILLIQFQLLSKISKRLARYKWPFVLIDESQGLKSRSSGWSRSARRLRHAAMRLILSGTPIDESPIDVWAQMRFADHTVLGDRWGDFADEYCYKGGFKNKKWFFNEDKLPQFLKTLEPYIYRLSADFLKLPPVNVYPVETLLLGSQRRLYDHMSEKSIVWLGNVRIRAPLAITQKVKLEEITGGFIKDEEGEVHFIGNAKLRKIKWLVRRKLEKPFVVFCKYVHEVHAVRKMLRPYVPRLRTLHGKVKDKGTNKRRTRLLENFQQGSIDGLICQLRTGGVSVEMTRASNLVFYSMNHSFIDFSQIIARLRRFGQTREVNVYLIYGKNTVDEEIIDIVDEKSSSAYRVMSHFEGRTSMAKDKDTKSKDTKSKAKKKKAAPAKSSKGEDSMPFGVDYLASKLKKEAATVRVQLRNAGVKKAGKSYGWATKAEADKVAAKLAA